MRLIFVRHGDPDYVHDTLTVKGEREASLLHNRVARWLDTNDTFDFYTSPLGRARRTAEMALRGTGREAREIEWLREFFYPVKDPDTGVDRIPWDWMPSWYFDRRQSKLHDAIEWTRTAVMKSGNIESYYSDVCGGLDTVLSGYGYIKDTTKDAIYNTDGKHCQGYRLDKSTETYKSWHDGRTAVFFCHLGVMFAAISHLLGTSPVVLWQSFFVATTSLTILASEEREPGTAVFRVQVLGDTQHLHDGGEVPSASGYFTDVFSL